METKITIEEKIKTLILEEIKASAIEACDNPTDDNISNVLNAVEYLKKILTKNYGNSQISACQRPLSLQKEPMWCGDPIMTNNGNTKTNNDDNIFDQYL